MSLENFKPLLPLRDIVIFPSMVVPVFVGREKSIKALQEVMKSDKSIVLVTFLQFLKTSLLHLIKLRCLRYFSQQEDAPTLGFISVTNIIKIIIIKFV